MANIGLQPEEHEITISTQVLKICLLPVGKGRY